jgi:hypothetical protein
MALPKSFSWDLPANFAPEGSDEAVAAEIVAALRDKPGTWARARKLRTVESAEAFAKLIRDAGNERVETHLSGAMVYARALPTPEGDPGRDPREFGVASPAEGEELAHYGTSSGVLPSELPPGVEDTSERRARGR